MVVFVPSLIVDDSVFSHCIYLTIGRERGEKIQYSPYVICLVYGWYFDCNINNSNNKGIKMRYTQESENLKNPL